MIFILGGKGFVGSAVARFCQSSGREYAIIDRQNYDSYKGKSCDIFINANGNSSKVSAQKDPLTDFDATVRSTKKSLIDFKFRKYVLLSSSDVYHDYSSPDITREDSFIDISKLTHYEFHKLLAEQCVKNSCLNWLIVRLGGIVGTGLKKNAIYDILNGGPLWLDPNSELQFMNTDDVAKTVFRLIDKNITNDVFNVCGNGLVKLERIMDQSKGIIVKENSPLVIFNVNIEKIQKIVQIPNSMETVINFMKTWNNKIQ